MKRCAPILAALLLACASSLLRAQAPTPDEGKAPAPRRFDCSKAQDPKGCEERRAKIEARIEQMHEAREKARKACAGKSGNERDDCMAKNFCAAERDPAKCEARLKERTERQRERRAAKDKPAAR